MEVSLKARLQASIMPSFGMRLELRRRIYKALLPLRSLDVSVGTGVFHFPHYVRRRLHSVFPGLVRLALSQSENALKSSRRLA